MNCDFYNMKFVKFKGNSFKVFNLQSSAKNMKCLNKISQLHIWDRFLPKSVRIAVQHDWRTFWGFTGIGEVSNRIRIICINVQIKHEFYHLYHRD